MPHHHFERDENSIRAKAYELWMSRGCPDGTAEQDWLEAERQLKAVPGNTASGVPLEPSATRVRKPASDAPSRKPASKPKAPSRAAPRARSRRAG